MRDSHERLLIRRLISGTQRAVCRIGANQEAALTFRVSWWLVVIPAGGGRVRVKNSLVGQREATKTLSPTTQQQQHFYWPSLGGARTGTVRAPRQRGRLVVVVPDLVGIIWRPCCLPMVWRQHKQRTRSVAGPSTSPARCRRRGREIKLGPSTSRTCPLERAIGPLAKGAASESLCCCVVVVVVVMRCEHVSSVHRASSRGEPAGSRAWHHDC